MNQSIYKTRRQNYANQMKPASFALFFSGEAPHKTTDQCYDYVPNRNFFYLTGLKRANFTLLLMKNQNLFFEHIFVEEASDYATKWLGKRLTKEEVSEICDIDIAFIHYLTDFSDFVSSSVLSGSRKALTSVPKHLYLDLYRPKPFSKPISLVYSEAIVTNYPELKILNANDILDIQRMVKSEEEIADIKMAISHTKVGIESILKFAKPGVNEHQIEALFEYSIQMDGSEGLAFNSIIASGKNATILHYEENNKEIKQGDLVLMDLGALSNSYASDISRTFPITGHFSKRQKEVYDLVLSVNKATIRYVKPGLLVSEINSFAKNLLAKGMIKIGLIKVISEADHYYYHNVSHYLGLDVHDVGTYQVPLQAGIVLTVEPGIYIAEEHIGIRIEDNILVTKTGHINLSEKIIKEVIDIEEFMK